MIGSIRCADDHDREKTITHVPCAGITEARESRVTRYLLRTGAKGGGAPNLNAVARDLFTDPGVQYAQLSKAQKKLVRTEQYHRQAWRNDHGAMAVFATACEKTVELQTSDGIPLEYAICAKCLQISRASAFHTALNREMPDDKNFVYNNNDYKPENLGKIYAKQKGIKPLIEDKVSTIYLQQAAELTVQFLGVRIYDLHAFRTSSQTGRLPGQASPARPRSGYGRGRGSQGSRCRIAELSLRNCALELRSYLCNHQP